ncbi:MAG: hypothetical protein ABI855_14660 [Bacteroidota bacterium]
MGTYHDDKEIIAGINDPLDEQEKKYLLGLEKYPEAKGHFLRKMRNFQLIRIFFRIT